MVTANRPYAQELRRGAGRRIRRAPIQPLVVPAKAGTHTPQPIDRQGIWVPARARYARLAGTTANLDHLPDELADLLENLADLAFADDQRRCHRNRVADDAEIQPPLTLPMRLGSLSVTVGWALLRPRPVVAEGR